MSRSKKHARDELDGHASKRIKLDSLFSELSIDDGQRKKKPKDVTVNVRLGKYGVTKPSTTTSSNCVDNFISEKLKEHFHHVIANGSKLIRWYLPHMLVVYYFQRWILRLFNRFLKKFNTKFHRNHRKFKTYYQITELINSPTIAFTYADLMGILDQENLLEMVRVQKRIRLRQKQQANLEDDQLSNIRYNYWDTIQVDQDMFEVETEAPRFEELSDYDSEDMDVDCQAMESNYGLYYSDP